MFCGFIWSPVFDYHNVIINELNNNYGINKLHKYHIYDFKKKKFMYEKSILDIYTTDDIEISKVKNIKIKNMTPYSNKYIFFSIKIDNPEFRIKEKTKTKISKVVENIKKNIREKYKIKVNNYIHDIIIHIADNFEQSNKIIKIMNKYKNFIKNTFMNTKVFLKYQFNKTIFTRYDMLVRKYSINEYLNNKDYDFALYKKMQFLRIKKNDCHLKFIELIDSLEKNGFDNNFPIEYEHSYLLRNGSHRVAHTYLKNNPFICISPLLDYPSKSNKFCNYGIDWFKDKFTKDELDIIINEYDIFMKYINS